MATTAITWSNWGSDVPTVLNAAYVVLTLVIAIAAIVQIVASRHFAQRQLRAYIYLDGSGIEDGSSATPLLVERAGVPWITLQIKNFGVTPAYDVAHWMQVDIRPLDEERYIALPAVMPKLPVTQIQPGGGTRKDRWHDRQLTPIEMQEITRGQRAIFISGLVRYRDAFGKSRQTTYRLVYSGLYPPVAPGSFIFCETGNSAM